MFWLLVVLFCAFSAFYFCDIYFLGWFQVHDHVTNRTVNTLQILYGMFGLAFGFAMLWSIGYSEGVKEGYEEGLREGYDKAFNGS